MSDEEKLNFFDSRIIDLQDELSNLEDGNLFGHLTPWHQSEIIKIKRNIQQLKSKREFTLDRLKLGIVDKPIQKKLNDAKQVFIATWFDESMNESIEAISNGIKKAGLIPECIKDEHFSERIMDKALSEIKKSRLVVIDLTGSRNSVFFEAGFAFGLGIEPIYVYKKDDKTGNSLEFYVKHYKCYGYKNSKDLEGQIENIIKARIGI